MREFDDDRMLKRANWHDYRERCYYMITINAVPGAPVLSHLRVSPNGAVSTVLTEAGVAVDRFLFMIESIHPFLRMRRRVVMPDHVHFLLLVTERLEEPVYIHIYNLISRIEQAWGAPVLQQAFHDRIIYGKGQLPRVVSYIADNPRKLHIKRMFPDLFTVKHVIDAGPLKLEAMGNVLLLDDLGIEPVVFSKHYTDNELLTLKKQWFKAILGGGVIISPFVHPLEQKVLEFALSIGGKAIVLDLKPFRPRQKPSGRLFDACAAGHLLLLAPADEHAFDGRSVRDICLFLNRCAKRIASGNIDITPI